MTLTPEERAEEEAIVSAHRGKPTPIVEVDGIEYFLLNDETFLFATQAEAFAFVRGIEYCERTEGDGWYETNIVQGVESWRVRVRTLDELDNWA